MRLQIKNQTTRYAEKYEKSKPYISIKKEYNWPSPSQFGHIYVVSPDEIYTVSCHWLSLKLDIVKGLKLNKVCNRMYAMK